MPIQEIRFQHLSGHGWHLAALESGETEHTFHPLGGQTFLLTLHPEQGILLEGLDTFSYNPAEQQLHAFTLPLNPQYGDPGTMGLSDVYAWATEDENGELAYEFVAIGTADVADIGIEDLLRPVARVVQVFPGLDEARALTLHMPADMPGVLFVVTEGYSLELHILPG